jgi:hypothetical protein
MATRRTLGELAADVQDLLRTRDKTAAAYTWVNKALGEIYAQTSGLMTRRTVTFPITAGAGETGKCAFEISAIPNNFVSPVSLWVVLSGAATAELWAPTYLPPSEFMRTASWQYKTSSALEIRYYTISRIGTNVPSDDVGDLRTMTLYIDPGFAANTTRVCHLTYIATPQWQTTPENYVECFPHWEHVLIWKAAAVGAQALKHRLADIFEIEANHALQTMYAVEKYQPDDVVEQQGGNLLGTRRYGYTLPQTIQESS